MRSGRSAGSPVTSMGWADNRLRPLLCTDRPVLLDGGMGTLLQDNGVEAGEQVSSGTSTPLILDSGPNHRVQGTVELAVGPLGLHNPVAAIGHSVLPPAVGLAQSALGTQWLAQ